MVVLVPVGRPIISLAPFATSTVFISLLLVLLPSLLPFSAGIALLIVRLLLLFPLARPLVRCLGVLDLLLPNDGLGQPLLWRYARLLLVLLASAGDAGNTGSAGDAGSAESAGFCGCISGRAVCNPKVTKMAPSK